MAELVPFPFVRTFLGLPDNETDSESIILQMLTDQVTSRFYLYVGYPLLTSTVTEIKDIDGDSIFLDRKPMQSLSSFRISYEFDWDNEDEESADTYYTDLTNSVIYFKNYNPYPSRNAARITYTAGYDQGSLPDSIRRVFLAQVRHEWMNKNQFGHTSISDGNGSVDVIGFELLKDVKGTLDSFRRLS